MTDREQKLAELSADLRRRIAKSPTGSPTARAAQMTLDHLESPTCALSTAERIKEIRETLRRYSWGLALDNSHHGPNCGPEQSPLRPQRP